MGATSKDTEEKCLFFKKNSRSLKFITLPLDVLIMHTSFFVILIFFYQIGLLFYLLKGHEMILHLNI